MSNDAQNANRQIARAAGLVMTAFVFSQVTGLVYQMLVADAFGTDQSIDAFNAANRVAETLFRLIAGGALGSAFIPTFTELLVKKDRERAWQLASAVGNLVLIVLASLGILAAVFAPQIVRKFLAPGFNDPAQEILTVQLMRIMLPSAAIFGISGLVMGVLNSNQVFLIPALTPAMYRLGMIFGTVVLAPRMGIYGLAWGAIIGALAHLLLQLPALIHQGGSYTLTLGLKLPEVREVIRLMGPRILGVAVVELNFWVNTRLASYMPEGSVTGITFAFVLMLMPQAAIAQSIATAAMPTLAAQFARKRLDEVQNSLTGILRGVFLLSFPAAVGLIMLRVPVIQVLLERGEFTERSTQLVAWALLWYTTGLVGHSVMEVLARTFYALHDTRTPVLVGVVAMSLNVAFSFGFSALFQAVGWMPHGGLALANSLATTLEMAGLLFLMRRRLNGLQGGRLLQGFGATLLGTGAMALAVWAWLSSMRTAAPWLVVTGGILIGGMIYGVMIILLRVPEGQQLLKAAVSRLGLNPRN
jgi:putative peptidoglycan lipid II flippase